jgi:formylglycine-generating enzyme required for sulfatase activity
MDNGFRVIKLNTSVSDICPIKGGSYVLLKQFLRTAFRGLNLRDAVVHSIGFRVIKK